MFKLLAFAASASAAELIAAKEPIDGSYIVVFKKDATQQLLAKHMDLVAAQNTTVKNEWRMGTDFRGYHALTDKSSLRSILEHESVDYVEQDAVARTSCDGNDQRNLASGLWGLSRTSNNDPGVPTNYDDYLYTYTGQGVNVYIVDTGIRTTHSDFGTRATHGMDYTGEGAGDENGHGTHCAGTACGTQYGIAKNCNLVAVKVLGRFGSGSFADVISGINWVANDNTGRPKVGSLSLGGGFSAAVNGAVDGASAAGVTMVLASGNSNADACTFSPASAPTGVTVNSIQQGDQRSSFSNFGTCTHIFAPGSSVLSAWISSDTSTNTISGTSMAAPHVAGQAAKLLEIDPSMSAADVKAALIATASDDMVPNPGTGSPNKLLYGC